MSFFVECILTSFTNFGSIGQVKDTYIRRVGGSRSRKLEKVFANVVNIYRNFILVFQGEYLISPHFSALIITSEILLQAK